MVVPRKVSRQASDEHDFASIPEEYRELDAKLAKAEELAKRFQQLNREAVVLQNSVHDSIQGVKQELKKDQDKSRLLARRALERRLRDIHFMTQPVTGSLYLRFFLGRVNVRNFNPQERLTLKNEYNKFKDRTTLLFLALPASMCALKYLFSFEWPQTHWMQSIHALWMLYLNTSLALRENVLRVNGSVIKDWWTWHHHLAALGSIVWLLWPAGPLYYYFLPQLVKYCLFQGFVQLLQNQYQKKRHYALRSLGKVGKMDIAHTETITDPPRGLLRLLLVFLFMAQTLQMYLGVHFMWTLLELVDAEACVAAPHIPVCLYPWWSPSSWVWPWRPLVALLGHWWNLPEGLFAMLLAVVFATIGCFNLLATFHFLLEKSFRHTKGVQKLHAA